MLCLEFMHIMEYCEIFLLLDTHTSGHWLVNIGPGSKFSLVHDVTSEVITF